MFYTTMVSVSAIYGSPAGERSSYAYPLIDAPQSRDRLTQLLKVIYSSRSPQPTHRYAPLEGPPSEKWERISKANIQFSNVPVCTERAGELRWSAKKHAFADILSRYTEPTAAPARVPIQTPKSSIVFGASAKHSKKNKLLELLVPASQAVLSSVRLKSGSQYNIPIG
jgi:hypothetical protein